VYSAGNSPGNEWEIIAHSFTHAVKPTTISIEEHNADQVVGEGDPQINERLYAWWKAQGLEGERRGQAQDIARRKGRLKARARAYW